MGDYTADAGFWPTYDNAFTRWLGWHQGDRDPELYAEAAFDSQAADLLAALPDTELTPVETEIVTDILLSRAQIGWGEDIVAPGGDADALLVVADGQLRGAAPDAADLLSLVAAPADPSATAEQAEAATAAATEAATALLARLEGVADAVPQAGLTEAAAAASDAGQAYAVTLAEGVGPVSWIASNMLEAFYNIAFAVTHPSLWLDWSQATSLMRFVYYGASAELFFALFVVVVLLTVAGIVWREAMWGMVRGLESFANVTGRIAAWAGFVMVIQQIVIIFMQRVFAVAELSFGFGKVVTFPISWWSEELKLYNAIVVTMCIAYTFVQGGHVRVDLVYARISFGAKRVVDMLGCLFFMVPAAMLIWLYGWFFMWRHLIVPTVSASDGLDQLLNKARALRWNVETIAFSPNGFSAYFLFKVLLLVFTAMMTIQAITFFWRSLLEWREGPESEGKYLDRDPIDDPIAKTAAAIH